MKVEFPKRLNLSPLSDGINWILTSDFPVLIYGITTNSPKEFKIEIVVPAGFKTDLASIPRLFWNILPPFGKYDNAAVIHDFLYRSRHLRLRGVNINRQFADSVLRSGMKACGVPRWKIYVIYYAVRLFGWLAWRNDRRWIKPV